MTLTNVELWLQFSKLPTDHGEVVHRSVAGRGRRLGLGHDAAAAVARVRMASATCRLEASLARKPSAPASIAPAIVSSRRARTAPHFTMREEYSGPLLPLIWRSMPDLGPSFR